MKSGNFAHQVFDTFATHLGLVYDVTDADCWAQYGGVEGRVFATFKYRINTQGT